MISEVSEKLFFGGPIHPKNNPKNVTYRDYKHFDENNFKNDIKYNQH